MQHLGGPTVLVAVDRVGKHDFLADLQELVPELWREAPGCWSAARLPSLRSVVLLSQEIPRGAIGYADWIAVTPPSEQHAVTPAGDVTLVLVTSGPTARPKGVALTHRHLIENGFEIGARQGLGPDDRLFLASPLCWSLGSANAPMATLTHATTLVLQSQFEPAGALDLIERSRCMAIYTLPLMTHALLSEEAYRPQRVASLRRGLTFGRVPARARRCRRGSGNRGAAPCPGKGSGGIRPTAPEFIDRARCAAGMGTCAYCLLQGPGTDSRRGGLPPDADGQARPPRSASGCCR